MVRSTVTAVKRLLKPHSNIVEFFGESLARRIARLFAAQRGLDKPRPKEMTKCR